MFRLAKKRSPVKKSRIVNRSKLFNANATVDGLMDRTLSSCQSERADLFEQCTQFIDGFWREVVTPLDDIHNDSQTIGDLFRRYKELYLLGSALEDSRLKNLMIHAFVGIAKHKQWYPTELAADVYARTAVGNRLRQLLVDFYVYSGQTGWLVVMERTGMRLWCLLNSRSMLCVGCISGKCAAIHLHRGRTRRVGGGIWSQ